MYTPEETMLRLAPSVENAILTRSTMPNGSRSAYPLAEKRLSVGAGDGNRTHDMQLGKLPFYH